jgi:site-specific DNA-methyltransferase (adenine-specific)
LKRNLEEQRSEDKFIKGALLGIMHGKLRKGGGTQYLSIDMPNTFSMSPDYVKRFVQKHQLQQMPIDVFGKLRERVRWLLREGSLPMEPPAEALQGDATSLHEMFDTQQFDAIVTSPPYLGVLRYGAFNWIRLWFLGYEPAPVDRLLDSTDSLDRYLSFMTSFLVSAGHVMCSGSLVVLVVGDVVEFGSHLQLAERVWDELTGLVPFELVSIRADHFDTSAKTTRIWGEERRGRATPMDRILVLERKKHQKSRRRNTSSKNGRKRASA